MVSATLDFPSKPNRVFKDYLTLNKKMMIDQCIFEVYRRDKKVFIPDFGAFIYSEYNDDVDFNDLLTFDDGKVVEEIQKQQSINEAEARIALNNYVQDIKNTLATGKLHFIQGFGNLLKDDNGSISIKKSDAVDTDEVNPEEAPKLTDHPGEPEMEDFYSVAETTESAVEEQDHSDWSTLPPDHEDKPLWEEETVPTEKAPEPFSYTSTKEEEVADKYEANFEIEHHENKGSKKLKTVAWVTIPLLILGIAAFYYFNFHQTKEVSVNGELPKTISEALLVKTPEQTIQEESDYALPSTEQTALPAQSADQADQTNVELPPASMVSDVDEAKTYCLVLGSFKIEHNAERYQQRLQDRGIEARKFKGRNGFYFVGMKNIKGKTNATRMLSEVKAENPNAWIINKERI